MDNTSASSGNTTIKVLAVFLVAALIGLAIWQFEKSSSNSEKKVVTETPTMTITMTTAPSASGEASPTTTVIHYKNGTYSATGNYVSPGGDQQVGVKITVTNDVVSDVTFTPMPVDRESAHYQSLFASGYKSQVVGKPLDQVSVTVVSGSSLTSGGFMDAVNKIKAEAKAS